MNTQRLQTAFLFTFGLMLVMYASLTNIQRGFNPDNWFHKDAE